MSSETPLLIVGEIVVDFTLSHEGQDGKLRLGGIAHAARGLWAAGIKYSVAAACPKYLLDQARQYLTAHGCNEFIYIGEIIGAPSVVVISDATEVSHQGYEDLLRDEKRTLLNKEQQTINQYKEVLVFPGQYDLKDINNLFSQDTCFSFDIAYDIEDPVDLEPFKKRIRAIIISTSSNLFTKNGSSDLDELISCIRPLEPEIFLLKENRGGSRLFSFANGFTEEIPAVLGSTVNSVGVGDVYSSVLVALRNKGWKEAGWRGASAATCYSQTTFPDDFRRDLQRFLKLPLDTLISLGGTSLPWHSRQNHSIYLAAPDFTDVEKPEIDFAIEALEYHNFLIRRPIVENGELTQESNFSQLQETFHKDFDLLDKCDAVFAIPIGRDPGTLVETGIAIASGLPVITFDPRAENANTMVIAGSYTYSSNFDDCLNGLFEVLSRKRREAG